MKRLWAKRWFWVLAGLLALVCFAALLACWRFRVWSHEDFRVYQEVSTYPIGEDLWYGRIQSGQDLKAFTAEHPPQRMRRLGSFVILSYYAVWPSDGIQMESMSVIAKNGRIVHASGAGCTWHREFFSMSAEDAAEFHQAWERHFGR